MKFGIVTDIHAGSDFNTKRGSEGLALLEAALATIRAAGCEMVIDLGDRISEAGREADLVLMEEIAAVFRASGLTHLHLFGNHDLYALDEADNVRILGNCGTRIVDCPGLRLVLFHGDLDSPAERMRFRLAEERRRALGALVSDAPGPTLLLSHVPLLSRSMEGSFYFERAWRDGYCYDEHAAIRSILEAAPHLVACFAGHVHWTSLAAIDGIHLVTIGSLTETFTTYPEPEGAFAIVTVGERLHVDVRGRAPTEFLLPLRPPGHRWLNMDRPDAPRPAALSARYRRAFGE